MKRFLTAASVLLFWARIVMAQEAATTAPSPVPSTTATPGTATAEEVIVQSQEMDIYA